MSDSTTSPQWFIDGPANQFSVASWKEHRRSLDSLPANDVGVADAKVHAEDNIDFLQAKAKADAKKPAGEKAERAIAFRLTISFGALGTSVAEALQKVEKVAKAAPDDPHLEDVEDRARYRADEIVDALDFSLLQDHAGEIGDDLEPVVGDAVVRAVADWSRRQGRPCGPGECACRGHRP